MKILHILNELKFSGAEIMYVDAAEEFQKLGCELYVANTSKQMGEYAPYFKKAGYQIIHRPYPKGLLSKWKYYIQMITYARKESIDVIHIHRSDMKWGMAMVASLAGKKSVYTVHNCFKNPGLTKPYQMWLRWSAKNIFGCKFQSISDSVCNNELTEYHNGTTKVYNWFGHKRFKPAESQDEKIEIRKRLGIDPDAMVLISVGGCSRVKRHEDIISILPDLAKKYPSLTYLHLGSGESTESEIELAKKLNVHDKVKFMGNQSNVRDFLVASDYYLMPSRFEGIPITTIEAMACKIPAILYDVDGLRDFNATMECSMLIKEDPKEITKAIDKLEGNSKLKKKLIQNAYDYIMANYYLPTNVRKIFDLYRS